MEQVGWQGVTGRAPSEQEFLTALQNQDLVMYVFLWHHVSDIHPATDTSVMAEGNNICVLIKSVICEHVQPQCFGAVPLVRCARWAILTEWGHHIIICWLGGKLSPCSTLRSRGLMWSHVL